MGKRGVDMAKLVHSYWTRPSMERRYGYGCEQLFYNLWYFALSCVYAKRSGANIVLHTDTLGSLLLGHLPYDAIYTTLDNIEAPPRFWAAGKFYAIDAEREERAIHIDGDVFIKKRELWQRMSDSDGDILVQYREPWMATKVRDILAQYMTQDYFTHAEMYNTGVLGIFNKELKRNIIDAYHGAISDAKLTLPGHVLNDSYFTPDLVCEQQMIAHKSKGYRVDCLLHDVHNCKAEANAMGYQHVLSSKKYGEMAICKDVLRRIDNRIYTKTKKLCQNL